jgi:two-component system, chemotaxis family, CheB/CheR fusion protein
MMVMPARRILVVDDNHDSADSLALLLSLHGHIVEARFTGEGLVDYALSFQPDLVLLDIGLPGRSGYEVVTDIRAEPRLAKVCVAALSGFGGRELRISGFDAHFVKPVDLQALGALIVSLPRR